MSPGSSAPTPPPVVRPLWSLAGPALGVLLAAGLLTAPIGPLGGTIQRDLGLSTVTMLATLVAPYVVAAAALGVPGYLLGRRWPTAAAVPALVFLVVGNLVSAFAPAAALMAVAWAVAGLGAGTVVGVALALTGQLDRWRSQARLALGLVFGAGLLFGAIVSGVLVVGLTWRMVFLVNVLMTVVALAVTVVSGIAMLVMRASRPGPLAAPATTTPLPSETQLSDPAR